MIPLSFTPQIQRALPTLAMGCLQGQVKVEPSTPELKAELEVASAALQASTTLVTLHDHPVILATREAYKTLGKEPSRYRPSAEALQRRILQGKGIYHVNNLVDLLNLVSIRHGYSIGGWDADQIKGAISVGIGQEDEPYETIGRGPMNIAGFPVTRDKLGAFGTPTSDSARTMVRPETTHFLMAFYAFEGAGELRPHMEEAIGLLQRYGHATHLEMQIFTAY